MSSDRRNVRFGVRSEAVSIGVLVDEAMARYKALRLASLAKGGPGLIEVGQQHPPKDPPAGE